MPPNGFSTAFQTPGIHKHIFPVKYAYPVNIIDKCLLKYLLQANNTVIETFYAIYFEKRIKQAADTKVSIFCKHICRGKKHLYCYNVQNADN